MALFYPRFVVNEFAPVFRLMDDLQAVSRQKQCGRLSNKLRSFQPRFDVTENKDSYELKGELPGIDQKNIEIAFTDEKTLTIKGHTESHREEGTRPTTSTEGQTEETKTTEAQPEPVPASSESETSSYHKASVEDEEYVDVVSESEATMSGANADATPTPVETPKEEAAAPAKSEQPRSKYWVSERSVGKFHRVFQFPRRLDQENVTASLKDGVLSIVVPKAPVPENKRIEIQ